MVRFSTSTADDTVDLLSSEKLYPVVAEKSVEHWDFGKPACTVIELDFSG